MPFAAAIAQNIFAGYLSSGSLGTVYAGAHDGGSYVCECMVCVRVNVLCICTCVMHVCWCV